jgi:hypothetical protein
VNPIREQAIVELRRMATSPSCRGTSFLPASSASSKRISMSLCWRTPPRAHDPNSHTAASCSPNAVCTEESTIPYDVDLVDLRQADPALVDEVYREGVNWRD